MSLILLSNNLIVFAQNSSNNPQSSSNEMINESQNNPNEVLDEDQINLDGVLEGGHGISDNLFPYSQIEEDCIDTVCDSIYILSMDDENKRNSIEEIGKSYFDDEEYQSMGGASIQTEIVLDNLGIPLYLAFNDPQFALSSVKSQCAGIINELKTAYGLNDFSYEHLDEYSGKLMAHLDNENKSDWYDELDDQFVALSGFLDIYGDMKSNSYMISTAATAKSIPELLSDYDFLLELPYFAIDDLVEKNIIGRNEDIGGLYFISFNGTEGTEHSPISPDTQTPNLTARSAYSKANARQYARDYARNPNPNFGYIENADCTNFVSQIMLAGGKNYSPTWITANAFGVWKYTKAWSNANKFVEHWKLDYTFTNHVSFSKKLKKGDYITYDKIGDGKWDHMGFVVNTKPSYDASLGYKDYRVAQHTSNYLRWAHVKKCGWDTLKSKYPKCIYGIVRI